MHLIIDFETLDTSETAIAVNCAYTLFDWTTFAISPNYEFDELVSRVKIDKFLVSQQRELGYTASQSTLDFWKSQKPEVRAQILPSKDDITIEEFAENLLSYVKDVKIERVWSRGTDFDFPILKRLFRSSGRDINKVYPYWCVRDIRTYLDTKFDMELADTGFIPGRNDAETLELTRKFRKHDSRHDIAMDILRLQISSNI